MAFLLGHEFGGAVQALFGLDHLAGGEAILAASVLAEFDQSGALRIAPMTALNCSIPSLCRCANIAMSRCVKVDCWCVIASSATRRIGDDPRAVVARDLAVHFRAVGGLDPFALDPLRGRADLALRLQRDALRFKAAMVDARVDVEFGQALVGKLGPAFAPTLDHLGAVPLPHLRTEAVLVHGSHGQHDMGVGLGRPVLGHIPMHIEVGDHALIDEFRLHKVAGEFDALRLRHLARKGELHLAGKLRVLPDLERLDIVPEPFAVAPCLGRILRQHDLGMDDAALVGEVVTALKPIVAQPRGRAVGGGRHRAGAGLAADDLDVKMIDRHRDPNITTAKRTSERRISAPSLEIISREGLAPSPARPGNLTAFRQALNYHRSIKSLWST